MTNHSETTAQVTLRSPAELADALPYLLGYRPEDSLSSQCVHPKPRRGPYGKRVERSEVALPVTLGFGAS